MASAEPNHDEHAADLEAVLAAYFEEVDAGRIVDEAAWLRRYPALRDQLAGFFRDQSVLQMAVGQSSVSASSQSDRPLPIAAAVSDVGAPLGSVGGYELIREIGRGGMGVVYEAHQPGLSRNVALKMLRHARSASPDDLRRLRNEAESIARLDHPAIVAVHDMGEDDGQFWFTMQLVRGQDLGRFVKRFMAAPHDAARVVQQIAEAVEHAHRRGVLHRDLKPGNILLDDAGCPHVSDFGLARRLDHQHDLTRTGLFLGTPAYVSPEQLVDSKSVTTATDIYGLGAILYFLLTGRPPHVADAALELLDKIHRQPIAPPSRFNSLVSRDLDAVCRFCLEKQPDDRYDSAGQLAEDLGRVLAGRPVEARTITAWERVARWRRRNPTMAWLAASVFGLLTLLAIGATASSILLTKANRAAKASLVEQLAAKEDLEVEKRVALAHLYQSRKSQARAARFSRRPGQRTDAVAAVQAAAAMIPQLELPDDERLALRNEQIAAMQLVDLVDSSLPLEQPLPWQHQMRPDRRSFRITDPAAGNLIQTIRAPRDARFDHLPRQNVRISVDNKYAAGRVEAARGNAIYVWRVGEAEPLFHSDWARRGARARYAFTRDATRLGVVVAGKLTVHDLPGGKITSQHESPGNVSVCFANRSDLAAVYGGSGIEILDWQNGRVLREFASIADLDYLQWSPDDQLLIGIVRQGGVGANDLHFWHVMTGEHRRAAGHASKVVEFGFHRDDAVVTTSWDAAIRGWALTDARQLVNADGFVGSFSRVGDTLLVDNPSGSEMWRVRSPSVFQHFSPWVGEEQIRTPIPQKLRGAAIHPDGQLLVSGYYDGLFAWNLADRQCMAATREPGADAAFSADGSQLFVVGRESADVFVRSVNKEVTQSDVLYKIGPPQRLTFSGVRPSGVKGSLSTSERRLGTRRFEDHGAGAIHIYDMERLEVFALQGVRRRQNLTALSPDGRLLAIAHWHGPDTHVWNVDTGELAHTIKSRQAKLAFSPDGKLLAVNEPGRCTVYEVESWQPVFRSSVDSGGTVARPVVFSPDGAMIAFDPGTRRDVRLLSTDDFRELATIRLPSSRLLVDDLDFSPDGALLFESSGDVIYQWDLREIRRELGPLDWDRPAYPDPPYETTRSVRVEIDRGPPSTPAARMFDWLKSEAESTYRRAKAAVR